MKIGPGRAITKRGYCTESNFRSYTSVVPITEQLYEADVQRYMCYGAHEPWNTK